MDITAILLQGLAAARPAAADVPAGSLYYATDTGQLTQNLPPDWTPYNQSPTTADFPQTPKTRTADITIQTDYSAIVASRLSILDTAIVTIETNATLRIL